MTRLALTIVVLTLLPALLAACAPDSAEQPSDLEAVSVKLSWHDGVQFLGLYVAQAHGYYAEEGLEVTAIPLSSSDEMDTTPGLVARGEIEFGVGGLAVLNSRRDLAITAIAAIYQYSPGVLFAKVDSGITTLADLAGKTVAVKSESWRVVIGVILAQGGLTWDDVTPVPSGFDMTPFYEGKVDVWAGFLTNELVRARQRGLDLVTFPAYEYGARYNDNMIYTGREALADGLDRVVRFLRASLRGWEWAVVNPGEAVDIMLERFPEMAVEADFHLASFRASIPLILPGGVRLGVLDCAAPQFVGEPLPDEVCTDEVLNRIREGD